MRVEHVTAAISLRSAAAVAALLDVHPYEEPAWDVVALVQELPDC